MMRVVLDNAAYNIIIKTKLAHKAIESSLSLALLLFLLLTCTNYIN